MSATTLPSLPVGGKVTQQVLKQLSEKSPRGSYATKGLRKECIKSPMRSGSNAKTGTKSGHKEFIDTASCRYSVQHNLCLEMLQDGYHWAFSELFNLLQQNRLLTDTVGDNPDEVPVLIENDISKLQTLREQLTKAETAQRRGRMDVVYDCQLALANYFNGTGDSWLADRFYMCCLATSSQLHGENSKKEAEAHYNLGLAAEKRDNYAKAVELMEKFYELSYEKPWEDYEGHTLFQVACDSLRRLYTTVADELEDENPEESLQYLIKAYEAAKESGYETRIAYSGYLLGNSYEKQGDPRTAILYHKKFLEACRNEGDRQGIGNACQALSRAHQRVNDIEHAIEYLDLFLEVSEELNDLQAQEAACSEMGTMYDYLGNYHQASQYMSRAYNKAKSLNDNNITDIARVKYGMAVGHCMFLEMANKIVINDRKARDYLIEWKSMRSKDELSGDESNVRLDQMEADGSLSTLEKEVERKTSSDSSLEILDELKSPI